MNKQEAWELIDDISRRTHNDSENYAWAKSPNGCKLSVLRHRKYQDPDTFTYWIDDKRVDWKTARDKIME